MISVFTSRADRPPQTRPAPESARARAPGPVGPLHGRVPIPESPGPRIPEGRAKRTIVQAITTAQAIRAGRPAQRPAVARTQG